MIVKSACLILGLLCAPSPDSWPGFRGDGSSATPAKGLPLKWSGEGSAAWIQDLPGYGQSSPVVWKGRVFVTAVKGEQKETLIALAAELATGKILWTREFEASQKGKNAAFTSRAASTPVVDAGGLVVFFSSGDLLGLSHDGETRWRRSLTKEYGAFKNNHGLGSSLAQSEKAVFVLVDHGGPSYLLAVDKATGKNLWKTERPERTSWTSPLVVERGEQSLVLVSSNGALSCYDARSGAELWAMDGLKGNTVPSPTYDAERDQVVVGAAGGRGGNLKAAARSNCAVRLTEKDGAPSFEVAWRGEKAVLHHASPLVHGGQVYFLTRPGILYCLDAESGAQRYAERVHPCWATPLAAGDRVYLFGKDGKTTVIKAGPTFEKLAENPLWTAAPKAAEPKKEPGAKEDRMAQLRRQVNGNVIYGAAAVDGTLVLRAGTRLVCLKAAR